MVDAKNQVRDYAESCDHVVDIIVDCTQLNTSELPNNYMASARHTAQIDLPNRGTTVFVKPALLIEIAIRILGNLRFTSVDDIYIANTVEEAMEMVIQEQSKRQQHKINFMGITRWRHLKNPLIGHSFLPKITLHNKRSRGSGSATCFANKSLRTLKVWGK